MIRESALTKSLIVRSLTKTPIGSQNVGVGVIVRVYSTTGKYNTTTYPININKTL